MPEAIIEPDLPIIDPHHHLWDRPGNLYLLDELLADTGQADANGQQHGQALVPAASLGRGMLHAS